MRLVTITNQFPDNENFDGELRFVYEGFIYSIMFFEGELNIEKQELEDVANNTFETVSVPLWVPLIQH